METLKRIAKKYNITFTTKTNLLNRLYQLQGEKVTQGDRQAIQKDINKIRNTYKSYTI